MSDPAPLPRTGAFPAPEPALDEVGAAHPQDLAPAFAFALQRACGVAENERRPLLLSIPKAWLNERGRPFGHGAAAMGIDPARLLMVRADKPVDALWVMEEALRSGAVCGAVGMVETPDFVATRRLDFAARAGRASAVLLRANPGADLSAARRRWRVSSLEAAIDPFDGRAPGRARMRIDLVRSRDGQPAHWILEQDDETGRLRLAAGLAGHGQPPRGHSAAG